MLLPESLPFILIHDLIGVYTGLQSEQATQLRYSKYSLPHGPSFDNMVLLLKMHASERDVHFAVSW